MAIPQELLDEAQGNNTIPKELLNETLKPPQYSVGGFAMNALKGAADIPIGLAKLAYQVPANAIKDIFSPTTGQGNTEKFLMAIPGAIKQDIEGKFFNPNPQNMVEALLPSPTQMLKSFYNNPIDMAMTLSIGAKGLSTAAELGKLQKVADIANTIAKATDIPSFAMKQLSKIPLSKAIYTSAINDEVVAAAKRLDVSPDQVPASAISNRPQVQKIINRASQYDTADVLYNQAKQYTENITNTAKNIVNKTNLSDLSDINAGKTLYNDLEAFKQGYYDTRQKYYDAAKAAETPISVKMTDTQNLIDKAISEQKMVNVPDNVELKDLNRLKGSLDTWQKGSKLENNFEGLEQTRKYWSDKLKGYYADDEVVKSGRAARLGRIVNAYTNELDSGVASVNKEFGGQLQKAKDYYKGGLDLLNRSIFQNIEQTGKVGNFSEIMDNVVNKKTPIEDIQRLFSTDKNKAVLSPVSQDAIKANVIKKIVIDSIDQDTQILNPNKYKAAFNGFDEDSLRTIIGDKTFNDLKDVKTLSSQFNKLKNIHQGEGTLSRLSELDLRKAAVSLLTSKMGFNKFVTTPIGQKWLTTGFKLGEIPVVDKLTKAAPAIKFIKQAAGNLDTEDNQ